MNKQKMQKLARIFSAINGTNEMQTFLEGILTPSEVDEIICRWQLMLRLLSGETQREISHDLGASLGKISRGSRLLKYGPPEFRKLIERIINDTEPASQ